VAHLIPWAIDTGPLRCRDRRGGKAPHGPSPVVSEEERGEGTNVDAYLNTTMFMIQLV
jgi:hypothetical protein